MSSIISQGQRGFALIFVIIMLMTVATVGVGFALKAGMSAVIAANQVGGTEALYVAEAGLSEAMWKLRANSAWRTGFTDKSFAQGSYTVTLADVSTSAWDPHHGSVEITSTGTVNGIEREVVQYVYPHTPALGYAVFTNGSFDNQAGATVRGGVYQGTGYNLSDADWTYFFNNKITYVPNDYTTQDGDEDRTYKKVYVNGSLTINHDNIKIEEFLVVKKDSGGGDLIVNADNFQIIQGSGDPVVVVAVNNKIEFNGNYTGGYQMRGVVRAGGSISIGGTGFKLRGALMAGGDITISQAAVIEHNPYLIRGVTGIVHSYGSNAVTPAELAWWQVFD